MLKSYKSAKLPQAQSPSQAVTEVCYIRLVLGVSLFGWTRCHFLFHLPQRFTDCPISLADEMLYRMEQVVMNYATLISVQRNIQALCTSNQTRLVNIVSP